MFVVNYINPLTYEEIKKVFKTKTGSKNNYNSTYRTAYECAKKIHRNWQGTITVKLHTIKYDVIVNTYELERTIQRVNKNG